MIRICCFLKQKSKVSAGVSDKSAKICFVLQACTHTHMHSHPNTYCTIVLICRGKKANGNKLALSFLSFLSDIIGIKLLMGDT